MPLFQHFYFERKVEKWAYYLKIKAIPKRGDDDINRKKIAE